MMRILMSAVVLLTAVSITTADDALPELEKQELVLKLDLSKDVQVPSRNWIVPLPCYFVLRNGEVFWSTSEELKPLQSKNQLKLDIVPIMARGKDRYPSISSEGHLVIHSTQSDTAGAPAMTINHRTIIPFTIENGTEGRIQIGKSATYEMEWCFRKNDAVTLVQDFSGMATFKFDVSVVKNTMHFAVGK